MIPDRVANQILETREELNITLHKVSGKDLMTNAFLNTLFLNNVIIASSNFDKKRLNIKNFRRP